MEIFESSNIKFSAWSKLKVICLKILKLNAWIWIEGSKEFMNSVGMVLGKFKEVCGSNCKAKITSVSLVDADNIKWDIPWKLSHINHGNVGGITDSVCAVNFFREYSYHCT